MATLSHRLISYQLFRNKDHPAIRIEGAGHLSQMDRKNLYLHQLLLVLAECCKSTHIIHFVVHKSHDKCLYEAKLIYIKFDRNTGLVNITQA